MMDWYSWLSKSSSLDPSLVYEYSVLFSRNELDADDIADFDHDFLRSMGVSVAKHRLQILRLANNHKNQKRIKIFNTTTTTTTKPKSIINNNNNTNNNTITTTTPHYYYRYYINTNTNTGSSGSSVRDSAASRPAAVSRLLAAISKTANCLARYIRSLAPPRADDDDAATSAIVAAAPRHESRGRRRTAAMLKRGRWGAACSGGRTDARRSRQPMMIADGRFHDGCGPPSLGGEEIRWDCMFEGLKPT